MTKLLTAMFAATFAFGLSVAGAQNVKSDQDRAQGQEQKMQEKEQGTSGAGQQGQSDRERTKTNDGRNAPSAGGPNSADKAETAMKCEGMTGHDKEECLEHANGKPADEDDAGAAGQHKESGDKYKHKQ